MKEAAGDVSHVSVAGVTAAPASQLRVLFVDWLRCLAAFQMLQGHTIAAVLAPAYRSGALYRAWCVARGLTSVAFLFAAGLSFWLANARELSRPRGQRKIGGRRARRALLLLVLGYALHLPVGALFSSDPVLRAQLMRSFVAVDVLQCIGVSLLLLELLLWACSSKLQFACASAGLCVLAFVATPTALDLTTPAAVAPLTAYFTAKLGSSFPLLPWSAHLFFGVTCGAWLTAKGRLRGEARLLLLAAVLLLLAALVHGAGGPLVWVDHARRLAGVLVVSALLAGLAARVRTSPPLLLVLARETLALYVFHVLLIYGQGVGLADRIGRQLAPGAAIAAAAAVVVLSTILVLAYRAVARRRLARTAQTG